MVDRQGQPIPGGIGDAVAIRHVVHMVKHAQGKLWVKSGIDRPTIFKVSLPIIVDSDSLGEG